MSEYPRNQKNNTFTWLNSLYNPFNVNFEHISQRALTIRNLGTHFFVNLITCLHTQSCTSHFVHLKQSFMHQCMLMCTLPCTYYKAKVNVRSIPLTINQNLVWVSRFSFIEKEITDSSLVYLEPNNQTTFCKLCLKAMNTVDHSPCLLI